MVYAEYEDEISGAVPGGRPTGKVLVRHEAPLGPHGETAIGYLKSSGDVEWTNPQSGEKAYKQDQQWVYDPQEAVDLAREYPDRFVRTRS